jgi:hypothetical protein
MRNILLSFCLLIFTTAFSQSSTSSGNNSPVNEQIRNDSPTNQTNRKFSFGAHISPTISWFNIIHNDLQTDGATITGGLGLIAEYNVNNLFSLVSGLNLNMPGGYVFDNQSMNDPTTLNNYLLQLYTLEIPLMIKIKTLQVDNLIYYTQGGLSAGYRIASKELHRASSQSYNDVESSFNNYSNPFQLNYTVGFGASYNTHKRYRVFGEVNYKSSFINLASEKGYAPTPVPDIYSGNMVFTVGVMF